MWADWSRRPVITLARTCCCFISLPLLLRNNDVIKLTKGRVDPAPLPPVLCFLHLDAVHLDLQEPPQNLESSICNPDEKWTFRFWTHLRLSPPASTSPRRPARTSVRSPAGPAGTEKQAERGRSACRRLSSNSPERILHRCSNNSSGGVVVFCRPRISLSTRSSSAGAGRKRRLEDNSGPFLCLNELL